MAYQITHSLATLETSKGALLSAETAREIQEHRDAIKQIISGNDPRKLIICGPCSIHSRDSALQYAERLKRLSEDVSDQLFLVMRAYFEKPRTQYAWKGFLHQPEVGGEVDLLKGLTAARGLLTEIAQIGVPAGTELLSPLLASYLEDLIAWGCIGARTSESQTHRELASALEVPVGFKNTTEGNVEIAINGMVSASQPHQLIRVVEGSPHVVISDGNPHTHLVLRGRNYPQTRANYDAESVRAAARLLAEMKLNTGLLVDCSHGNSEGDYLRQMDVAKVVLEHIQQGISARGILIESHLRGGRVSESADAPNDISITDPCLGWGDTERLIRFWAEALA